jgi:two-component system, LytTR family, sensor kinase
MVKERKRKLLISLLVSYAIVLVVNIAGNFSYYVNGGEWTYSVGFSMLVTTLGWAGFVLVTEPLIRGVVNWSKYPGAAFTFAIAISGAYGVVLMIVFIELLVWFGLSQRMDMGEYVNNCVYSALFSMLIGIIFTAYEFLRRWKKGVEDNERLRTEMVQARYEALKNQVNPHFLFNSLNTLASIIPTRPDVAVDFVQQLSRVFRYSLQHGEGDLSTVAEEMKIVSAYIFLNKQRFDGKLQTDIRVDDTALQRKIVTQSILMLVENAIKHNEISTVNPLTISIYTVDDTIVVKNTLQKKLIPEDSTGIGLNNIKMRYSLLGDYQVDVRTEDNNFIVTIPLLPA